MAGIYNWDDSFRQNVAMGKVRGASTVHKFGAVPAMSQNQDGTIWDVNDTLYPWAALDTPAVVNVERNNPSDNGLFVTVQGLDENYKVAEDTIEITGADQVGTQLFRRVNRAFVTDGASTNVGNIDIEAGAAGGSYCCSYNCGPRRDSDGSLYCSCKLHSLYIKSNYECSSRGGCYGKYIC